MLLPLATHFSVVCQTADPPKYSIGDFWKYSETDALTGMVTAIKDYEVTDLNRGRVYRTVTANGIQTLGWWSPDLSFRGFQMFEWPLAVGKKWKSRMTNNSSQCGSRHDEFDAEVKSIEQTLTPAGTFQTFIVEHNGFYSFGRPDAMCPPGRRKLIYWYSSTAKRIVRFEDHWNSRLITREELMDLRVAP